MNQLVWITFAVVCDVASVLFAKYYLTSDHIWAIFASVIALLLLLYAYLHLLQKDVGLMYALLTMIPIIIIVLIGITFYSERIKSYQWVGLVLGVIAIILLAI